MTLSLFILVLSIFLFFGKKTIAQDCPLPQNNKTLQGNFVTANITTGGNTFWDGDVDDIFSVPNTITPPLGTIISSGLWLGALDQNGSIKIAATRYDGPFDYDYSAGPILEENGQITFACEDYDQLWEVFGYEIQQHISDFEDNGIIDQPIENIFGYPAHQNPFFENINGFVLPNTPQGLAPFFDQNSDGIYNPNDGDFPLPESVSQNTIPSQIIWKIFNDAGSSHTLSNSDPLNVEVQQTVWSFWCEDNPILNYSIFSSYKIINRGNETLDSMSAGIFTDFDLGCYTDDYFGCAPNLNTYYSYNHDSLDGTTGINCDADFNSYGANPPVQAVTFLNQSLTSYVQYYIDSFDPPSGVFPPQLPQEFFHFLNGQWGNGLPITYGTDGYNTGGDSTKYLYPDNPNDSLGWSMETTNWPYSDWASLGNNYIGSLPPGAVYNFDIAYSFYQDSTLNNIETVNLVYDYIPLLQQMYDSSFSQGCLSTNTICEMDCVWVGDANRDSIVNNCDILQIGLGYGEQDFARNTPLIWAPFEGIDWGNNIDAINLKHTDCSGDGNIDSLDFYWVEKHFSNSYKKNSTTDIFNIGSDFQFTYFGNDTPIDSLIPLDTWVLRLKLAESKEIFGLALTIDYDSAFLEVFDGASSSPWENQENDIYIFTDEIIDKSEFQYAAVKTDGINSLSDDNTIVFLFLKVKPITFQSVETVIRVKNIKAILNDGTVLDYGAQPLVVTIQNPDGSGTITSLPFLEKNNIQLFPNPTTHLLNVKLENPQHVALEVFDIYGKKVFEQAEHFNSDFQLPIEQLSEGVYFLKVKMDGAEVIRKFIKI